MRISDWSSDVCSSDLQIRAMLADDLWLANARAANAGAAALALACGDRLLHPVEANELFVRLAAEEAARLRGAGFDFYDWGAGAARLVVSWDQDADAVAPLAARSEEHTSELQSLMRISYAVFCLKKKKNNRTYTFALLTTLTQEDQVN